MILWTLQITLFSLLFIFLIHHLIVFFKDTLTIPKVKDLVNVPVQNYESIYNIIQSREKDNHSSTSIASLSSSLSAPSATPDTMKNELKSFLKKQLSSSSSGPAATNSSSMTSGQPSSFSFQSGPPSSNPTSTSIDFLDTQPSSFSSYFSNYSTSLGPGPGPGAGGGVPGLVV